MGDGLISFQKWQTMVSRLSMETSKTRLREMNCKNRDESHRIRAKSKFNVVMGHIKE